MNVNAFMSKPKMYWQMHSISICQESLMLDGPISTILCPDASILISMPSMNQENCHFAEYREIFIEFALLPFYMILIY